MRLELNKVYQGDFVEKVAQIDAESVDLVFADPPFNIGYDYDLYNDRRSRVEYLGWSRTWMSGLMNVLKPTGTFWLAIGDEYAAELKVIAQDEIGFTCRSWVIWYYTFGVNCVRGFSRSHTHLFHFVKDPDNFTFNAENPAVRVLSARQLVYRDARANPKGRLPDNTWIFRPQDAPPSGFASMHDTWYFARVAGTFKERERFHGCQMPEQLLGRILRISSNPQEIVLDPFAGSGTTLAVAKKLGRQWLGVEFSRDYVKSIRERLGSTQVGEKLDGPADPVRSAPKTSAGRRRVRLRNGRPLPQSDKDTERGIIDAYRATCEGNSTDYILCDPDLNAEFVAACRTKGLPGDAFIWNRLLLRFRKAGKLQRVHKSPKRLTFAMMDAYSYASEIAMQLMSLDYAYTLDDILCSPKAAAEFDQIAEKFAPGFSPFKYRWAALAIRKRARQSRSLAKNYFLEWRERKLPRATPLSRCDTAGYEQPGVYVLAGSSQDLYVGETFNVRTRIEQKLNTDCWRSLNLESLVFVPSKENRMRQHGLQAGPWSLEQNRYSTGSFFDRAWNRPFEATRCSSGIPMPDVPGSNAERSLAICSLFESEVLVWLLLRNWHHPLAEDGEFRNQLLETATAVLDTAATGPRNSVFIEGLPASDMNLIAAIWYAENRALEDLETGSGGDRGARLRWLEAVRRALPSCFCPQDRLA